MPAHPPSATAARPFRHDPPAEHRPAAARPMRRYRSGVRPLEDRVSMSASPWSDLDRDEVVALLAGASYVENEIVVALEAGSPTLADILAIESAHDAATAASIASFQSLSAPAQGATDPALYRLTIEADADFESTLAAISNWTTVEWAAPNFVGPSVGTAGAESIEATLPAGSLDPTFAGDGFTRITAPTGSNEQIVDVARQADGKLVALSKPTSGESNYYVVRFNADGTLDATFGVGGKAAVSLFNPVVDPTVSFLTSVEIAAGGKILVAGHQDDALTVVRLNTDGSRDVGFGSGGLAYYRSASLVPTNGAPVAMTLQSDGKIVLANHVRTGSTYDTLIVRFTAAGALDTTFNGTGTRTVAVSSSVDDVPYDVVIQSDGKIIVAGSAGNSSVANWYALRLTSAGSLDSTFGSAGVAVLPSSAPGSGPRRILSLSDGKILLGGVVNNDLMIARLNTNGSFDTSFGFGGSVGTNLGGFEQINSLSIQSDGKIVGGGYRLLNGDGDFVVVRLSSNGIPDTSLNGIGWRTLAIGPDERINALFVESDGKYLVAGHATSTGGGSDLVVARLNSDATFDGTFGTGGVRLTNLDSANLAPISTVTTSDGSVLVLGSIGADASNTTGRWAVWRLRPDGTLETGFGTGGYAIDSATTPATPVGFVRTFDGRILVVTQSSIVRLTAGGLLDTTFNGTGSVALDLTAAAVTIDSFQQIIVAGTKSVSGADQFAVRRYSFNGAVDGFFGAGGLATVDLGAGHDRANAVAVTADNRILVAGLANLSNPDFALVRLNLDGSLDWSFSSDGIVVESLGADDVATSILVSPDGKIVVGGWSGDDSSLVRYAADGTLDAGFGSGGKLIRDFGDDDLVRGLLRQSDGKLLVLGVRHTLGVSSETFVARLQADGSPDASFIGAPDGQGLRTFFSTPINQYTAANVAGTIDINDRLILAARTPSASPRFDVGVFRLLLAESAVVPAPTIWPVADQTIDEGGAFTFTFQTVDSDTRPEDLRILVTSSDPEIVAAENGTLTSLGGGQWRYTATVRPHQFGNLRLTISAFDGVNTALEETVITIRPINDTPSFVKGSDQTITAGVLRTVTRWARQISAGYPNEFQQALTFEVVAADPSLFDELPTIAADGTLSMKAKAGVTGSTLVTVRLRDDGGTTLGGVDVSAAQTFTITVNNTPVNQAPTLSPLGNQTIVEGTSNVNWTFTVADDSTPAGSLLVTAPQMVAASNFATVSIRVTNLGGGQWRLDADPHVNASGTFNIPVTVSDGSLLTTQNFVLGITNVNNAPSFAAGPNQTVEADAGPQSITGWAYQVTAGIFESSQQLTFEVTVDDPSLFAVLPALASVGTLTYTPSAGKSGTALVTVRLTDDGGTAGGGVDSSAEQSFTIRVLASSSASGSLDPTFSGDGVSTATGALSSLVVGRDVAIQDDGKIVVVGVDESGGFGAAVVVRYLADGSLDLSFGDGGKVRLDRFASVETAHAVEIAADGKIYVAVKQGSVFALARLNADGALDTSFSGDGWSQNLSGTPAGMALQADGKMIVVGVGTTQLFVARLTVNGVLDSTFGTNGLFTQPGWIASSLSDVAMQNDGRIVVTGKARLSSSNSTETWVVVRLTAFGAIDTSFGVNGVFTQTPRDEYYQGSNAGRRIAVDGLGRIVAAGATVASAAAVIRMTTNGVLDPTFGEDGYVAARWSDAVGADALTLGADGSILLAGYASSNGDDFGVVRLLADGSYDLSFNLAGRALLAVGDGSDTVYGVALQSDGRIVLVGQAVVGENSAVAVVRLLPDGMPDRSFAGDGRQTTSFGPMSEKFGSIVRQADGKYLVAGALYRSTAGLTIETPTVRRYLADGTLDATFADGGTAYPTTVAGGLVLALQADGKILGLVSVASGTSVLVRLNADGSLDSTFAGDGSTNLPSGFNGYGIDLAADGKIVVAGRLNDDLAVARFNTDGTLDTTFSHDGVNTLVLNGIDLGFDVEIGADGKIVVVGNSSNSFVVCRFKADGDLDATFDGDGWTTTDVTTGGDGAWRLVIQTDGKIVAGGSGFDSVIGDVWSLVRYDVDGSLDSSFDVDGIVLFSVGATNSGTFGDMLLQADGRIVVVGSTAGTAVQNDMAAARFLPSGKLDPTFGVGGSLLTSFGSRREAAQGLAIEPDGRIVVVGYAEMGDRYEGTMLRLLNDTDQAPTVAGVYVRGSTWNAAYLDHLNAAGVGDPEGAARGFALAAGAAQTTVTVPWSNVDRITLRFDRDIVVTSADALELFDSTGAVIAATAFRYVDGRTVEWTVPVIATSKYWLRVDSTKVTGISELKLDGEWTTSTSTWAAGSGDGTAGGNFDFRFNVLSGDFDSSGTVSFGEIGQARLKLGATTASADFDYRQDYDGTGSITFGEIGQARNRLGASLSSFAEPPPPPGAGGSGEALETFTTVAAASETAAQPNGDPRESTGAEVSVSTAAESAEALLPAGTLDPTFDADGMLRLPVFVGSGDFLDGLVRLSDGKYLAIGSSSDLINAQCLVRFNSDGTLDTTFGDAGRAALRIDTGGYGNFDSLAVADDGKIIVAGINGSLFLARFQADGTPDLTFDGDGLAEHSFTGSYFSSSYVTSMVLQSDGKIVVARTGGTSTNIDTLVARFTTAGALDTSFNGTGFRSASLVAGGDDIPYAVALQSDGKIVVVGAAETTTAGVFDFYAARYTTAGALDTTFGTNGVAVVNVGSTSSVSDKARRVAIQTDGRIVIGGESGNDFGLIRLNANGTLDTTFDGDGRVTTNFNSIDLLSTLNIAADGRIIAGGYARITNDDYVLARYLTTGALDTSLDGDGKLTLSFGPYDDVLTGLVVEADGSMTIGGYATDFQSGADFALTRLLVDGGVDANFGQGGTARTNVGVDPADSSHVITFDDGRIFIAGTIGPGHQGRWGVWSILPDGSPNAGFGAGGVLAGPPASLWVWGFERQGADKLLLLTTDGRLTRITLDGTVDTTFGTSGSASIALNIFPQGMTVAPDGSVAIFGSRNNDFSVTRVTAAGAFDLSFGGDGNATYDLSGSSDYAWTGRYQSDGKLVVAGTAYGGSSSDFALVRINPDGTLDTTFGGDGIVFQRTTGETDSALSIVIEPDGRIVLAGVSDDDLAIARYLADGTPDASFGVGGKQTVDLGRTEDNVQIVRQADGKFLVVGGRRSSTFDVLNVLRLNSDGSRDFGFGTIEGLVRLDAGDLSNLFPFGAALQADGKLIVSLHALGQEGRQDAVVWRISTADQAAGATPTITNPGAQTVDEDGSVTITFSVDDADTPRDWLQVSLADVDPELFAAGNLSLERLGGGLWSLTAEPRADRFGSTAVTLRVSDGATSSSTSFTLTVRPVDDRPSFTAPASTSTGTNFNRVNWAQNISRGNAAEAAQNLTFEVTAADPTLFDVQPAITADGTLTFTAKPTAVGQTTSITVVLRDDGGTAHGGVDASAPQAFTLVIGNGPTIAGLADMPLLEGIVGTLDFTVADADTSVSSLTASASSNNSALLQTVSVTNLGGANRQLTVTPRADVSGTATVTVSVSDGVRFNSYRILVTVAGVNDAPSFVAGTDLTADAISGLQTAPNWATSITPGNLESAQQLTFEVTVDVPSLFAVQPTIDANGTLRYAAAAGRSGFAQVTVRLHDDGGTADGGVDVSPPQTFVIRTLAVGSQAGDFDPTLDGDGLAAIAGLPGTQGKANAVALQADGKIVIAGTFTPGLGGGIALARYLADGTLDTAFGTGGIAYIGGVDSTATASGVEIAADGRIYVAINYGGRFTVARRNADGSADLAFGVGGLATRTASASEVTNELALQADGKIVVVGTISGDLGGIRFNVDGSIDTTFGAGGTFRTSLTTSTERLSDVVALEDGSLVAVGFANGVGQVVVRLTSAGAFDASFDGDGILVLDPNALPEGEAHRIVVDGRGRWLISGRDFNDLTVVRLNADGSFDRSFNDVGYVRYFSDETFGDVRLATAADGRIVVAGSAVGHVAVRQFLDDGSRDLSFNGSGQFILPFGVGSGSVGGVVVVSDGRIIVAGQGFVAGRTGSFTARITIEGALDPSFAGDGFATLDYGPYSLTFASVVRQADGKYVVGGTRYSGSGGQRTIVARFNSDGTLDHSFGLDGFADSSNPAVVGQSAVAIAPDGRIVALAVPTGSTGGLVRYDSTGFLDPTFGGDGVIDVPTTLTPYALAVQADGKILLGGRQSGNFAVFRYNTDGTLDTTFSGDGMFNFDVGGSSDFVRAIVVAADGKIVLGGYRSNGNNDSVDDFAVARVNTNGTLDITFDGDGWNRVSVGTGMDLATSVVIQPDGRIVLGGSSKPAGSSTEANWALVRFNVNGSLDTSFDGDGILSLPLAAGAETIYGLTAQADGRIVAVGLMERGGVEDTVVARFLTDGTLDPTFAVGGLQSTSLSPQGDRGSELLIDPDGRIVVVGRREINGRYEGTIVRLLNDVDAAPQVAGIYVKGSTWNAAYLDHLNAAGVGDPEGSALGFALAAGASQLTATIPWSNVDRITLRFDRDVVVTSADALKLYDSAGAVIAATAFRYVDGRTVEWSVPTIATSKYWIHVDSSKVTGISELQLDGEWTTSTSTWGTGPGDGSGNGTAGGGFDFRFNVLSGDFDSSGSVAFGEIGQARLQLGKTTAAGDYNYRQDYDGSGSITFADVGQARGLLGASLSSFAEPPPPPGAGDSLEAVASLETFAAEASFDPRESIGGAAPAVEFAASEQVAFDASKTQEAVSSSVESVRLVESESSTTASFLAGPMFLRPVSAGPAARDSASAVAPAVGTMRRLPGELPYRRFDRPSKIEWADEWAAEHAANRGEQHVASTVGHPWRRLRRKMDVDDPLIAPVGDAVANEA